MKPTTIQHHELTVSVKTESGKCAVTMALDEFSREERKFLFDALRKTRSGGSVAFGIKQTGPGERLLELLMREAIPVGTAVKAAIIDGQTVN